MTAMREPSGELRDGFRFRGGHIALDLVATLSGRLKPVPRDLLATPADLDRWLIAAGLGAVGGGAGAGNLMMARELREAICQLVARDEPRAREVLNRIAAGMPATPRFDGAGRAILTGTPAAKLATVAREAILLLGGPNRERVRRCEGEGCAILFLDGSRRGDRRWCSMAGCGNRAKAAGHRLRHRTTDEVR